LAFIGVALAASACHVHNEPAVLVEPALPPPGLSALVVRWTIDGLTDPNQCVSSAAAVLEVSIVDPSGREIAAFQGPCTDFALSITLAPGDYAGSALLLDGAGNPRSTVVVIDPFTLLGNDTLNVPVDFPASSFL
jgi:hypothetical protein